MIGLENARRKLPQFAGASIDDEIPVFVQLDATRATYIDSDAVRLGPSGEIQIVFQLSWMTIECNIDSRIKMPDAGFGVEQRKCGWSHRA